MQMYISKLHTYKLMYIVLVYIHTHYSAVALYTSALRLEICIRRQASIRTTSRDEGNKYIVRPQGRRAEGSLERVVGWGGRRVGQRRRMGRKEGWTGS